MISSAIPGEAVAHCYPTAHIRLGIHSAPKAAARVQTLIRVSYSHRGSNSNGFRIRIVDADSTPKLVYLHARGTMSGVYRSLAPTAAYLLIQQIRGDRSFRGRIKRQFSWKKWSRGLVSLIVGTKRRIKRLDYGTEKR
jgi:hypothetical protein